MIFIIVKFDKGKLSRGEGDMLNNIWDFLINPSFWQGTVVGLVLYKLLEKAFLHVLGKIRIFFQTKKEVRTFSVKGIDSSFVKYVKFGYLLIRFGRDDVLKETLTDDEKRDAILQNKEIYAKSYYDENKMEINVSIPLKVHKALGVQFKCFVDVLDFNKLNELKSLLEGDEKFDSVGISGLVDKHRIYFLLKDVPEAKTPEGIVNNFIYPT